MEAVLPKRTRSGIGPIDSLLGGLEIGKPYLAHGYAVGVQLCATQFLIEGLRQGESVGLVTSFSTETIIEAFERLGHSCLRNLYDGRLVVVRCAPSLAERVAALPGLAGALIELEFMLGDSIPDRVAFHPFDDLAGARRDRQGHLGEFAEWVRSLGSTSLLVADEASSGHAISAIRSLVAESFCLDRTQRDGASIDSLIIENRTPALKALIDINPSKGISLLSTNSVSVK